MERRGYWLNQVKRQEASRFFRLVEDREILQA